MEHDQFLFVIVESPTWLLYVTLLLTAVFFRFSRLLTVRNLDMVLLLLLSTALVVSASSKRDDLANAGAVSPAIPVQTQTVEESQTTPLGALNRFSSFVVLALSVILIVRLTFDESLTRRPRLEQNLNQAGLTFLFFPAFTILMTGVFLKDPPVRNIDSVKSGVALLQGHESSDVTAAGDQATPPATETIIAAGAAKVAELSGQVDSVENRDASGRTSTEEMIARILVVVAHTTVVVGLMYIGRKHFCSAQLGVSMCCLYLLLPCTAFNVHELSHVVPGACLTWAFAMYRKPAVAGVLLGLACGTLFFAVFLLPLWAVFYGRKGSLRFGISLGAVAAVVLMTFALTSATTDSFVSKLVMTANWTAYRLFDAATPMSESAIGHVFLRIILAALFFVMFVAMTVIPRKRNLENLLANSTALIVAAQLWYPEDVGSYVLWYLPLLMLVMFRPRLDRFVPPEADHSHTMQRPSDQQTQQGAGTLSRVTLYH
ncbi:MAG: hypothetical protein P8K08_26655 [Fuerstiella sp.]|nr:hypothetical protein [Fuerstiella sp.]